MIKINKLALAVGSTFVAGLSSSVVSAESNPFQLSELSSGYMNIAEADAAQGGDTKMKDGSCGEGKCGNKSDSTMSKAKEGKCGEGKCGDKKADMSKAKEGKCGEGKCGENKMDMSKSKEGKCGEGKCGDKKVDMDKAKEGKCGEGKCGDSKK